MSKLYLLEPGFVEDSVLYEVQLIEVERMPKFTAEQIANRLKECGVKRLVIDAGYPPLIERLKQHFVIKKILRLTAPTNKDKNNE